jgi:type IV secretory pathway VirB2 component (pilin)
MTILVLGIMTLEGNLTWETPSRVVVVLVAAAATEPFLRFSGY